MDAMFLEEDMYFNEPVSNSPFHGDENLTHQFRLGFSQGKEHCRHHVKNFSFFLFKKSLHGRSCILTFLNNEFNAKFIIVDLLCA